MWQCFREALDPVIRQAFIGYCTRAEAPNWANIPKELADSPTCPRCGAPRVTEAEAAAKVEARAG